jgi:hypothetical protein
MFDKTVYSFIILTHNARGLYNAFAYHDISEVMAVIYITNNVYEMRYLQHDPY